MTFERVPVGPRALLAAGLLLGISAAQAASGFTVRPGQESLVTPGMSADAVRQLLGRPAANVHYGNEPGPTFSYRVVGSDATLFDVDFGADGKVVSTSERVEQPD